MMLVRRQAASPLTPTMPNVFFVEAILFDLDGTLIDSTPGVMVAWDLFAKEYHFDAAEAAHASHGRRLTDTLKEWCKLEDEESLQVRTSPTTRNALTRDPERSQAV